MLHATWSAELSKRTSTLNTQYTNDRLKRGLDYWAQPDPLYPAKLDDWCRSSPEGRQLLTDRENLRAWHESRGDADAMLVRERLLHVVGNAWLEALAGRANM